MAKPELGILQVKNPREIWENEEKHFTPWIAENINQLSEAIGIPINIISVEKRVGRYELDIYGNIENSEKKVIIENQLTETDHKHLGQLITYAAGLDAAIVIWIVSKITDEHKTAIIWLNQHFDQEVGFYLVQPEILQIDNSKPAVRFNVEVVPSEFTRSLKEATEAESAPRHEFNRKFWEALLEFLAKNGHPWAEGRKTTKESWISSGVGKSGVGVNVSMAHGQRIRVEVYFSNDSDKQRFKCLELRKDDLEKIFNDENISWEPLEDTNSRRVAVYTPYLKDTVTADSPTRRELFNWIDKNLKRFREVAKKYVD